MPQTLFPAPPTFPFSSPITEEIPSPASSSPDRDDTDPKNKRKHNHNPKDRPVPKTRDVDVEVLSTSRQTPLVHSQRDAHKKSMVADTDSHFVDELSSARTTPSPAPAPAPRQQKPVGLNLVTDFESLTVPHARGQASKGKPTLVDLTDLRALCRKRERERSAQKIRGILKKRSSRARAEARLAPEPAAPTLDGQEQRKRRKSELSPSDRPIPIGLSVSYVDSDSNAGTSGSGSGNGSGIRARDDHYATTPTPLTPSIMITSAGEETSFWEDDEVADSPQLVRPRPRSSVYSQPTPIVSLDEIPPVPAIPARHSSKVATPVQIQQQQPRNIGRARFSTATVFEEDSPQSAPTSATSSKRKALDRLSINTDTNRHQSQGWWTYLLSPLFKRLSTATTKTPTSPRPGPTSDEWWEDDIEEEKEISCFSPDTPASTTIEESSGSIARNPFLDASNSGSNNNSANESKGSGIFAGQAIEGCAAEYYQACAHELFSGTPYFQCVGHVCSLTPAGSGVAGAGAGGTTDATGVAVIAGVGAGAGAGMAAGIGSGAVSPNSERRGQHRFSGSTAINETPVAKTPAINKNTSPAPGKNGFLFVSVPEGKDQDGARPVTPVTPFYLPVDKDKAITRVPVGQKQAKSTSPVAPFYVAPVAVHPQHQQPLSPNPISPAFQQATEGGSIPLSRVQNNNTSQSNTETETHTETHHVNIYAGFSESRAPRHPEPVATRGSWRDSATTDEYERERSHNEARRKRHEKEEKVGKKASSCWRGRGPFSKKGCLGRSGSEGRKKRRWCVAIALVLLVIVLIALLLAVFLSRSNRGSGNGTGQKTSPEDPSPTSTHTGTRTGTSTGTVVDAGPGRWLNLTGYPPMPTGVASIAGPKATIQQSGCIHPTTLWSCALPPEMQDANQPYDAEEPSFRVDIQFRNGTYPRSTTLVPGAKANASASETKNWTSSPSQASQLDQRFLGNTTDGNDAPFDGEETPFYMSFLSLSSSSSGSDSSGSKKRSSSSSFPDLDEIIPAPAMQNGEAAPANLYPLPSMQPIRLFNRGKDTEYYGFYTYFDRSIFLATQAPLKGGFLDSSQLKDHSGGSSLEDAQVRCTWSQTRFFVQIWTGQTKSLLQQDSESKLKKGDYTYTRPGSFPYPVSITLDRHGGSSKEKMVYCYGMDDDGGRGLNATAVKLQVEDRGYSGSLISPAPGVFNSTQDSAKEAVDGGDGGCKCQWTNWT